MDAVQKSAILSDLKEGASFSEMLSFWVVVTRVGEDGAVEALSHSSHPKNPGVTEDRGRFFFSRIEHHTFPTKEAFLEKFYFLFYFGVTEGHLRAVTAAYLYQEAVLKTLDINAFEDINAAFKTRTNGIANGKRPDNP